MREPMRVIEGNAKPGEAFWTMRTAAENKSGEAEVEFFGPISEFSWFGDEITPAIFRKDLYEKGAGGPVTLLVDSPGGDVWAANTIRAILLEYPGKVTADILGLAASGATLVVNGADRVRMREGAMYMIHEASSIAWGTAEDLNKVVNLLNKVNLQIVDMYKTRTGLTSKKLAQMMADETWMTGSEAMELGFVDEVVKGSIHKAPKNMRAGFVNCLKNYEKVPVEVVEGIQEEETSPQPSPEGKGEEKTVITDGEAASAAKPADNEAQEGQKREAFLLREAEAAAVTLAGPGHAEMAALRERVQSILERKQL